MQMEGVKPMQRDCPGTYLETMAEACPKCALTIAEDELRTALDEFFTDDEQEGHSYLVIALDMIRQASEYVARDVFSDEIRCERD